MDLIENEWVTSIDWIRHKYRKVLLEVIEVLGEDAEEKLICYLFMHTQPYSVFQPMPWKLRKIFTIDPYVKSPITHMSIYLFYAQ